MSRQNALNQEHKSPAEFWFKHRFERAFGMKLVAGDDWLCPETGIQYEVKDIRVPFRVLQAQGYTCIDKKSITRHAQAHGSKCILVLVVNESVVLWVPVLEALEFGTEHSEISRRETALKVPLSVFKEMSL